MLLEITAMIHGRRGEYTLNAYHANTYARRLYTPPAQARAAYSFSAFRLPSLLYEFEGQSQR